MGFLTLLVGGLSEDSKCPFREYLENNKVHLEQKVAGKTIGLLQLLARL